MASRKVYGWTMRAARAPLRRIALSPFPRRSREFTAAVAGRGFHHASLGSFYDGGRRPSVLLLAINVALTPSD